MNKYAYELQEHQKRVAEKLKHTDSLLVYHKVGAGKTLTALNVAEQTRQPLTVIGPASLRNNFNREKQKHGIKTSISTHTYNKPSTSSKGVLVFDEAHKMGNTQTQRSHYPDYIRGDKTLYMTGTPIKNSPEELIPIMRGLNIHINRDPKQFNDTFVAQVRENPGLWARLVHGAKPGVHLEAKNLDKFKKLIHGKVDYYEPGTKDYPKTKEYDVNVEMSKNQEESYRMAMKGHPSLAYKIKHGISPAKSESGQMNAFLTATRQISNFPGDYSLSSSIKDAPKITRAAKEIEKRYKSNPNYRGVSFSNYIGHGISPLGKILKEKNIPYSSYTGKMSQIEKDQAVKDYNSGKIKQLLISGAGSEGLDLKKTRLLQILEPSWNVPNLDQVRGRVSRYKSHEDLPEAERNVEIQNFIAKPREHGFIFKHRDKGTDEYLQMMARNKQRLNSQFLEALQEEGSE